MYPSPFRVACAALFFSACSLEVAGAGLDPSIVPGLDSGLVNPLDSGRDSGGTDAGGRDDSMIGPVVDAAPGSCDDGTPSGGSQERTFYEQAQLKDTSQCRSEKQTRTCSNGVWSTWTGTFQNPSCDQAPFDSCGSTPHGSYQKRTCYKDALVSSYNGCTKVEETALCTDGQLGDWSGDCANTTCNIKPLGSCTMGSEVKCTTGTTCSAGFIGAGSCLGLKGSACEKNGECSGDFVCINKVCTDRATAGGACDETSDCSNIACINGTVTCESTSKTCRCSNGSFCGGNNECLGTCYGGIQTISTGKCVAINTSCDNVADCISPNVCNASEQCRLPENAPCTANSQCSTVCRDMICTGKGMSGDHCDENVDCAAGWTCFSFMSPAICGPKAGLGQQCDDTIDCNSAYVCASFTAGAVTFNACLLPTNANCDPQTPQNCASGECRTITTGENTTAFRCK